MIVVDVNTIAYLWIPGELTHFAEAALRKDAHWVSSILWKSEFRNILAGYLRRGQLDTPSADRCLEGAESQMASHEYAIPSLLVMQKVAQSSCSAYDCEYVALAQDLGTVLVTSDNKILAEFPRLALSLRTFARRE